MNGETSPSHILKGWAGTTTYGSITGWCLYSDMPDRTLEVEFLLNGRIHGTATANEFRQHLVDRGYGTGMHGFRINLDRAYPPEELMQGLVRLRDAHDQTITVSRKIVGSKSPAKINAAQNRGAPKKKTTNRLRAQIKTAQLIRELPASERWRQAQESGASLVDNKEFYNLLLMLARGCLYQKDLPTAYRLFNALIALREDNAEATFFLGATYLQDGHLQQAGSIFSDLYNNGWKPARSGLELAKALSRQINSAGHAQNHDMAADYLTHLDELLTMQDRPNLPASLAQTAAQLGDLELAERVIDESIADRPDQPEPLVTKTRILIELRKIDEAMELADQIIERWPDNLNAINIRRVYGYLRGTLGPVVDPVFIKLTRPDEPNSPLQHSDPGRFGACGTLDALFEQNVGKEDLLVLGPVHAGSHDAWRKLVMHYPQAGCIIDAHGTRLWRAKAVRDLELAGLIELQKPLPVQLAKYEKVYVPRTHTSDSGPVVLLSRYGIAKFGGAEHTMENLAHNYKSFGLEPHILGIEREAIENHSAPEGIISGVIEDDPSVMRRYFIENGAAVVHAISGMGYQVAQALEMTNITFIYGVYFWRDVLGRGGGDTFFEGDDTPIAREEFRYVMAQAQTIFANSEYTRDIVEAAHGIRCPVIPSIPGETA